MLWTYRIHYFQEELIYVMANTHEEIDGELVLYDGDDETVGSFWIANDGEFKCQGWDRYLNDRQIDEEE